MLVERKYPLSKELLQRMLDFGLEVEVESTAALDLIRVLNSPCFMVKSWLVQDQTVLGKDYSNLLIADSLLKTIWFINAPCYGNEALASPKANGLTIPEQMATDVAVVLKTYCRRRAKDVKETLRTDQDLLECLNTSSMKFKETTPKKHEVKQVQQSCLGEDCWELYIPDLVPFNAEQEARFKAKQEQERIEFETALELKKQLDEREELKLGRTCVLKNEGGYKLSHFKGMKYEDIKPIFERVWDQNQAFVPKDSKIEKEVMKRSGFIQKQSTKEEKEKKKDEKKAEGGLKRKASKHREDKDKRQKKQDDPEKLMEYVEVISDSEEVIRVTPLAVKSPIVGWKSYCKEDVGYYEIHRADRN
ncbi:hypothetical protein Tco_1556203 [Tanacetum coccineum]